MRVEFCAELGQEKLRLPRAMCGRCAEVLQGTLRARLQLPSAKGWVLRPGQETVSGRHCR